MGHSVTVIALLHARTRLAPVLLHAISALAWHCAGIVILLVLGAIRYYWDSAALFGLSVMLFVFGFSAVYKSVTLRALAFIQQHTGMAITTRDLYEQVVMRAFRERVNLLTQSGLTSLDASKYSLMPAGRKMVNRISGIRSWFGVSSAGLYFKAGPNSRESDLD